MQVSCQVGKHEGCASLPPPPNSLELFTLFSLPFLHFYNFLGTQVEWGGGRSLVLSGPRPVCCWLRISVGTRLLFSFFSSSQAASLPRPPAESGIRVFFLLGRVYSEAEAPEPASPSTPSSHSGGDFCPQRTKPHTSVCDPD